MSEALIKEINEVTQKLLNPKNKPVELLIFEFWDEQSKRWEKMKNTKFFSGEPFIKSIIITKARNIGESF